MVRTQIQIPDEIYENAKEFCRRKEISLAELCRRSLEDYLIRWAGSSEEESEWSLPTLDLGTFQSHSDDWRILSNEVEPQA